MALSRQDLEFSVTRPIFFEHSIGHYRKVHSNLLHESDSPKTSAPDFPIDVAQSLDFVHKPNMVPFPQASQHRNQGK